MINAIRSEWIKFRSIRSNWFLLLGGAGLVVLVALIAANDTHQVNDHLGDLTPGLTLAIFLFSALGVQIIGQEYRFNTIRPTFTAEPRRARVLAAKLVVVSAACAVAAIVMLAVCALIGSAMVDGFSIDGLDQRVAFGTVLFAVGSGAMGMGVGAILRQPVAGIVLILGEAFVAENVLGGLKPGTRPWLPFLNGLAMSVRDTADLEARSALGSGVFFFATVAVVLGIGLFLAHQRDA